MQLIKQKTEQAKKCLLRFGVPEGIRTPDLLVRSQTLYPAELQAQIVCWYKLPNYNIIINIKRQVFFSARHIFSIFINIFCNVQKFLCKMFYLLSIIKLSPILRKIPYISKLTAPHKYNIWIRFCLNMHRIRKSAIHTTTLIHCIFCRLPVNFRILLPVTWIEHYNGSNPLQTKLVRKFPIAAICPSANLSCNFPHFPKYCWLVSWNVALHQIRMHTKKEQTFRCLLFGRGKWFRCCPHPKRPDQTKEKSLNVHSVQT